MLTTHPKTRKRAVAVTLLWMAAMIMLLGALGYLAATSLVASMV